MNVLLYAIAYSRFLIIEVYIAYRRLHRSVHLRAEIGFSMVEVGAHYEQKKQGAVTIL